MSWDQGAYSTASGKRMSADELIAWLAEATAGGKPVLVTSTREL